MINRDRALKNKRIAIMQPYFFPYLGYFQLIQEVDTMVLYDNIEYTKKGWINRNQYLQNGEAKKFSLPLEKASDFLFVDQRHLSQDVWPKHQKTLLAQISNAYRRAPFFEETFDLFQRCIEYPDYNLFNFIQHSIFQINSHLNIDTKIIKSSSLSIDEHLKGQSRVLNICKTLKAKVYVNPIGGTKLYAAEAFNNNNITLKFHEMDKIRYQQFNDSFIGQLSILDVLMFNSVSSTKILLSKYQLQ